VRSRRRQCPVVAPGIGTSILHVLQRGPDTLGHAKSLRCVDSTAVFRHGLRTSGASRRSTVSLKSSTVSGAEPYGDGGWRPRSRTSIPLGTPGGDPHRIASRARNGIRGVRASLYCGPTSREWG
jgi:hypothetical protein